jgi:hypothetical protein
VKVLPQEVTGPIQTPLIEQESPFRYPKERDPKGFKRMKWEEISKISNCINNIVKRMNSSPRQTEAMIDQGLALLGE